MAPGIVLKSKFVMPGTREYQQYIQYITRDEAGCKSEIVFGEKEDEFALYYSYMDYMGDEGKQGILFTSQSNVVNEAEKKRLQEQFQTAQKNGSPLWQDVISFDNSWLQKHGVMDKETGQVDEAKMRTIVREAMDDMLQHEEMKETALWSAAIHYNTDNIHVHIATVEPLPTRKKIVVKNEETGRWEEQYRAKRKQKSLDKMKSKVANLIVDRTKERKQITSLIRGSVQKKKDKELSFHSYRKTKKLFREALKRLPADRKQWQYGYQSIQEARPYIDEIVTTYLDTFYKKEMKELYTLLDEEVDIMKELYGEKSRHKQYKQTQLEDLQKRMGNAVLTEMRVYQKQQNEQFVRSSPKKAGGFSFHQQRVRAMRELNWSLNQLHGRLGKTFHEYQKERNQEEFDWMLDGYER